MNKAKSSYLAYAGMIQEGLIERNKKASGPPPLQLVPMSAVDDKPLVTDMERVDND